MATEQPDRYPPDAVHVTDEDDRPTAHYYGDGCPEHPARQMGLPIQPGDQPIRPVHPRDRDRLTIPIQPDLDLAIDDGLCIVLHTRGGTLTITDVDRLVTALRMAQVRRNNIEDADHAERAQRRAATPTPEDTRD